MREPSSQTSADKIRGTRGLVSGAESSAIPPWDRRRDSRVLAILFVIVWVVYLLTAAYSVYQVNDTRDAAISSWSLGTRGTLALPEAWPDEDLRWHVEGVDGQTYTNRFPGAVLWGAPFYAVGEQLDPRGEVAHPFLISFAPAGVAAATAAALTVAVAFAVYRRVANRRIALGAAAALAFATGTWSVSANALWTHSPGQLMLALGMLGMACGHHLRAGAGLGLAILCRPHLAVVPAVVGIWEGIARRAWGPVLKVGIVSSLGLLAMVAYSRLLFGTWMPVAGYGSGAVERVTSTSTSELPTRALYMVAHPLRGLLVYTPILLVLVPGVIRAWRVAPPWVRSSAVACLVYLAVQIRANTWHGGADYFGNRLALETLLLLSPLLVLAFRHFVRTSRILTVALTVLLAGSVLLHAYGATLGHTGFYGDDDPEAWEERVRQLCEEYPDDCP